MAGSLHSRVVAAAKIGLPVAALAIMSTLFLGARQVDPSGAVPVADASLSDRARDQQLTAPRITGRTQGGTPFDLRAQAARPDAADPRRLTVDALSLTLGGATEPDLTAVSAAGGTVDSAARTIVLAGDVRVDTTAGFRLRTQRLEGSLGVLRVVSPGPVRGDAPFGTLSAGGMVIEESADGADGRRFVFTDGVTLLYAPPDP